MISVQPLAGGSVAAGYYLQREAGCAHEVDQLAAGRDMDEAVVGYYLQSPGAAADGPGPCSSWLGGGARALGLDGRLDCRGGDAFRELLAGSFNGRQLIGPVWRYDERGHRVDVRRSAFDVTFSAPKSVSLLMGLGEPDVAAQVRAAHQVAIKDALALLETLSARVARGHQGDGRRAPRIGTSGLVAAGFEHLTSRANDPQLHTHVVVMNLAHGTDGRWSALDSRTLHREATTVSYLYQHRLRAELSARLGVRWTDVEKGIAEIDGVPLAVRREFSTRRRQIEAALDVEQPGPGTPRGIRGRARHLAARIACLATRPAKTEVAPEELSRVWLERAEATGFGPQAVVELLRRTEPPPIVAVDPVARQVLEAGTLTRERSTFGRGSVLRELIARLPGGAQISTTDLLATAAEIVLDDEVVPVVTRDGRAYTTRELLATEAETLALATRTSDPLAVVDRTDAAAAVGHRERHGLRPEQQRLAFTLLISGRPVEIVSGPAGCGKTASLRVATEAWRAAGVQMAGTAVAAVTAQGLEQASGAPSASLARLLHHPDRHLPIDGVLLVDEAGMIGTRSLHQLLTLAAERQCKVVLVGDPAQLPEMEAGGMFARLAEHPNALKLEEHRRQRHSWERASLDALRAGEIHTALHAYRLHDRLHTHSERAIVHTEAVDAYVTARRAQSDPWQTVLLATTRCEVAELNALVRARLLADRTLGAERFTVDTDDGPVTYRVGDQVLVTRNDHQRGLLNGTAAIVTSLGGNGLTLATSRGQDVRVDRQWVEEGRLEHGYAMTVHKAQGRTVHTALVVGSPGMALQAGYVGLSRGTEANHLFVTSGDLHELLSDCGSRVQHLPAHLRQVSAARPLTRDSRQRLASDLRTDTRREAFGR